MGQLNPPVRAGGDERIAEGDVDAERLTVDLPSELALGAEAQALILHALVLDLGVMRIGPDLERHEIAEVAPASFLQSLEDVLGRAHESEIHVLRGARQLEHEIETAEDILDFAGVAPPTTTRNEWAGTSI